MINVYMCILFYLQQNEHHEHERYVESDRECNEEKQTNIQVPVRRPDRLWLGMPRKTPITIFSKWYMFGML